MLRSKTFLTKSRKNKVIKRVVEHYLRDDIACGLPDCSNCPQPTDDNDDDNEQPTQTTTLLGTTPRHIDVFGGNHYLIPDTNVFMNQIDIIEHKGLNDVIVLQTVLGELRHNNLSLHNRLRTVIADPERRFFVFANEHRRETFIEKLKDESPNDRNDRAIRVATKWYRDHLAANGSNKGVVLLTDDVANKLKAREMGLKAVSVREYVEKLTDVPELVDMVAQSSEKAEVADAKVEYEEHLTATQIATGIKSGQLFQGKLSIATHNVNEGSIFAKLEGADRTIVIVGRQALSRAIHGDIVAVRLLPKDQWRTGGSTIVEDDEDDEETETKDENPAKPTKTAEEQVAEPVQPQGVITGIIRRNWRPFCGFIVQRSVSASALAAASSTGAIESVLFKPIDRRIPTVRIRTRQAASLLSQRIVVAIDSWPKQSRYPSGHFVKSLGAAGDRDTEIEVLLLENEVPHSEFAAVVLKDLPVEGENWIVKDDIHLKGREDFRHLNICSIDPPGCTDIDDALHLIPLPNGNFEAGVHIADVTHFVKPNTEMDKEAASRGTTVYLVNRRIDMLPGLLGTNLCSLRSNVDRLAFSCIWELTPDAQIVKVRFVKSVIRSKASLTYDEAQSRIDDTRMTDEITESIRSLNKMAKLLHQRRLDRGALTLASPEVRFKMEDDNQDPVDVEMKELKDTNRLVEEFMLLANISVAERIFSSFPDSSLLRRHPTPPETNFELLQRAVEALGLELRCENSKAVSDSLEKAVIPSDPYFNKLLRVLTTRCMMQAQYFSSGTLAAPDFRHYGLASEIYTHFTSPIRRYSDVIVHRLLTACVVPDAVYGHELTDKTKMEALCNVLNHRHRMAQQAARGSVELFTHLFFKGKTVLEEAYVTRVFKNGFNVLVPRYGIEGIVYLTPDADAVYDPKSGVIVVEKSEEPIRLFLRVIVKVSVDEELRGGGAGGARHKLLVELVEPKIPHMSVDRGGLVLGGGLGTGEIDGVRLEDEAREPEAQAKQEDKKELKRSSKSEDDAAGKGISKAKKRAKVKAGSEAM